MPGDSLSSIAVDGARTVFAVHEHFQRLKQSARVLSDVARSSDRGYFTPSEDEETRHLLISYWQSRNALLEVVLEMKDTRERDDAFLVGYAGALVLADAAWFLRREFDDRPVVREKLNEPAPTFGIPEGVYDRVQASLANPVHAWHLYHAASYFDENRTDLQTMVEGSPLAVLPGIIEQMQTSAHVSLGEYAVQSTRVRARQLVSRLRGDLLQRALYGLQKSVSSAVADLYLVPGHDPGLPESVVAELRTLMRPGDVIIVRKEHAVTNYFLPGFWPHAALYLGSCDELAELGFDRNEQVGRHWDRLLSCDPDEPCRVQEAKKDGVWIRSFQSPLHSDAITILRPRLDQSQVLDGLVRGMSHTGKPYDFDFDFTRSDRLVCTEVVYRSFEGIGDIRFNLTRRAGRMTLSAEDLIAMAVEGRHFDPVATYAPPDHARLQTGSDAADVLRATAASLD
ncbi:MAG: YiiX/YebB-like N1pC/P60 family cysteine hydrolase [Planctomycetaceae bacterium]